MSDQNSNNSSNELSNVQKSEKIVKDYLLWTGAAGIIPVPFLDTAAIAGFQIKMLQKIGEVYGQNLSSHWIKSSIGALTGGYASMAIGKGIGKQLIKAIPIIGGIASVITAPGFAAASTYALGQIFIMHFESGGTLLNFKASAYAAKMKELVAAGVPATPNTPVVATPADNSSNTPKAGKS